MNAMTRLWMGRASVLCCLLALPNLGCGEGNRSSGDRLGSPPGGRGSGGAAGWDEGGAGGASWDPGAASEGSGEDNPRSPAPGQLTAGEWRDLDNWSDWLAVLERADLEWSELLEHWTLSTHRRIRVAAGAVDAPVELQDAEGTTLWIARTDNAGEAFLFAPPNAATPLSVVAGEQRVEAVEPGALVELEDAAGAETDALDLMFVIDTTGSMCDELDYIQAELLDVVGRVEHRAERPLDVRIAVSFYRDEGDAYVVRSFPFEGIEAASAQLREQGCDGGGDTPEAVDAALADAIEGHEWRSEARARLLFVVLDAPPHDTAIARDRLGGVVRAAAERGVRILPVASSGVDKPTEAMLRAMAILTGGTYVFLTNQSGIGGAHIEPTIGAYEVELFNDLLVRIIGGFTD